MKKYWKFSTTFFLTCALLLLTELANADAQFDSAMVNIYDINHRFDFGEGATIPIDSEAGWPGLVIHHARRD